MVFLDLHNASLGPDALADPLLIETKAVEPLVPNTFNDPDWLADVSEVPIRISPLDLIVSLSLVLPVPYNL